MAWTARSRKVGWRGSLPVKDFDKWLKQAREDLGELGVTKAHLDKVRAEGQVEVAIPSSSEESWAGSVMPWEFVLRMATATPELLIWRHLKSGGAKKRAPAGPKSLLFVENNPAPFNQFSFDGEYALLRGSFQAANAVRREASPSLDQMLTQLEQGVDVLHWSGMDTHQGNAILRAGNGAATSDTRVRDGLVFASCEQGSYAMVSAGDLAQRIGALKKKPTVVAVNAYYSAARICPWLVARGVRVAVGFQNIVDDALAERFFAAFYQHWRGTNQLLEAYAAAWRMAAAGTPWAAGIVLWTDATLQMGGAAKARPKALKVLKIAGGVDRPLLAEVRPRDSVNYARLQNGQGLFERFEILKFTPDCANGVRVEVSLHTDSEPFAYETVIDMGPADVCVDLNQRVTVPLTSRLARSLRESVISSLRVRVTYDGYALHTETHRVKLLAVNEWSFDREDDSDWLASFVLPLDPAVLRTVDLAQKYLVALRDDGSAGFDGYQSTDDQAENPDEGIDQQVRAIWSALAFELCPAYINPPPVFQAASQRLRTPSDVLDGRRGTCIDLALLLAACLEYVEIYPVIFVLSDHAFPGYWRSEADYAAYEEWLDGEGTGEGESGSVGDLGSLADKMENVAERRKRELAQIQQWVAEGALVPLETVWLTQRRGFADAVDEGHQSIAECRNFEVMVDIVSARAMGITPLPVVKELA